MKLSSLQRAGRWAAIAALLALAGCAAYPAQPGAVASYCDDPAWCVGPYPETAFGLYDYTGVYPYYDGWWHGGHDFHRGWHPGFAHRDFAMHAPMHAGFGGFHGGFHGGFAHIGMAGHFGGGHRG